MYLHILKMRKVAYLPLIVLNINEFVCIFYVFPQHHVYGTLVAFAIVEDEKQTA